MVFEYARFGNLRDYLQNRRTTVICQRLCSRVLLQFARQVRSFGDQMIRLCT